MQHTPEQSDRAFAIAHVSSDCDDRTKAALADLVRAAAKQAFGYTGQIDTTFVIRDEDRRLAEYLKNTEAFDA